MENSGEKVAVITGASRGIGAGLVETYRKHGYAMIANSPTADSLRPEIITIAGDVACLSCRHPFVARCCWTGIGVH